MVILKVEWIAGGRLQRKWFPNPISAQCWLDDVKAAGARVDERTFVSTWYNIDTPAKLIALLEGHEA